MSTASPTCSSSPPATPTTRAAPTCCGPLAERASDWALISTTTRRDRGGGGRRRGGWTGGLDARRIGAAGDRRPALRDAAGDPPDRDRRGAHMIPRRPPAAALLAGLHRPYVARLVDEDADAASEEDADVGELDTGQKSKHAAVSGGKLTLEANALGEAPQVPLRQALASGRSHLQTPAKALLPL